MWVSVCVCVGKILGNSRWIIASIPWRCWVKMAEYSWPVLGSLTCQQRERFPWEDEQINTAHRECTRTKKKKSVSFICFSYLPLGILHNDHFSFTSLGPALITQTTHYMTVCKYIKASHCCAQVHLKLFNVEGKKGKYGITENHWKNSSVWLFWPMFDSCVVHDYP